MDVELMVLPVEYGTPKRALEWAAVRQRIEESTHVWLATTRPDGRPHVVPVDGLWVEDAWYFGGSEQSVHVRNLRRNPWAALHLGDAVSVVIAEGRADWVTPPLPLAKLLVTASKEKYGYAPSPQAYLAGVWCLRPQRVLAWENFPRDATRFNLG
jgi:Pyridoxamine 5'-phosphate oxidase